MAAPEGLPFGTGLALPTSFPSGRLTDGRRVEHAIPTVIRSTRSLFFLAFRVSDPREPCPIIPAFINCSPNRSRSSCKIPDRWVCYLGTRRTTLWRIDTPSWPTAIPNGDLFMMEFPVSGP